MSLNSVGASQGRLSAFEASQDQPVNLSDGDTGLQETEVLTELRLAKNCFRTNYLGSSNGRSPSTKKKKIWVLMIKADQLVSAD